MDPSTELTLDQAIATPITEPIPSPITDRLFASSPFISIPGLFNARDLSDVTQPASNIRPAYIYRSGSLEKLTEEGRTALLAQGITTVFDLRSHRERSTNSEPSLPGIQTLWQPSTLDNDIAAAGATHQEPDRTNFSFAKMYAEMLISHRASLKAVFEHIRDQPDRPFLFHCTAGKDRTGLMAALILGVAGCSIEYINRDYALTRIGIEPVRDFLIAKLMAGKRDVEVDLSSATMQAYAQIP